MGGFIARGPPDPPAAAAWATTSADGRCAATEPRAIRCSDALVAMNLEQPGCEVGGSRNRAALAVSEPAMGWIPIAAGAGVLGLTMVGVVAARAPGPVSTAPARAPAAEIEFTTAPEAPVARLDPAGGATPMTGHALALAAGETAVLVARLPGYVEDRQLATASHAGPLRFHPTLIRGYEGTWRRADGTLVTLAARGTTLVETRADAPARDWATISPEPDTGTAAEYASPGDIVDAGGPDISCRFSLEARYRYDARADTLERRQEDLTPEVHGNKCVAAHRAWGPAQPLVRVTPAPRH